MSAIDPAIAKAAENVGGPTCPDCGHLVGEHSHDVGCMTDGPMVRHQVGFCPCQRSSLGLIAATVEAARAEGDKQGAARVREAVEAVLATPDDTQWWPVEPYMDPPDEDEVAEVQVVNVDRVRAALTEAAPHD